MESNFFFCGGVAIVLYLHCLPLCQIGGDAHRENTLYAHTADKSFCDGIKSTARSMKINRLLEILTLLLRHRQITAPELAKRLEVSRRTIGRDIDDLCRAGIPIVTRQGAGGGIAIAEGYKLDKSLLTPEELQNILVGLQGLGSVDGAGNVEFLRSKLTPQDTSVPISSNIFIDLASYYKESLSVKINLLKKASAEHRLVEFLYFYEKGKCRRRIEPYFILFRWSAWYVLGYCVKRADFRLFKLNRLWDLRMTEETFSLREVPAEKWDFDAHLPDRNKMVLDFDPSVEYLIVEEYGPESYTRTADGTLRFEWGYTNLSHALRWVLGFGGKAKVLFPPELELAVAQEARKIAKRYIHL